MIDFEFSSNCKPQKGRLLISEPFMKDDFFERSVVLLCDYDEDGAFGFVLNKYIEVELEELNLVLPKKTKFSIGGPVEPQNLYFIHTHENIADSVEITEGIYAGGDFDVITDLLKKGTIKPDEIRFFIGYSGWSSGQLEEEIKVGSWVVVPTPKTKFIMDTQNENLWKVLLEKKGGKFKLISQFPNDPMLN